uniref:Uncharacterized protein n=1 Tax=Peronospora matthiolae TaxID=2874970 RepID=A0AAV1VKA0_9STRA
MQQAEACGNANRTGRLDVVKSSRSSLAGTQYLVLKVEDEGVITKSDTYIWHQDTNS